VNIAGTILQNGLQKRIPPSLIASLPRNWEIAYIIISLILSMSQPLKAEVQDVFLQSLWQIPIDRYRHLLRYQSVHFGLDQGYSSSNYNRQ
jgi:hypothetical protein